jgi:hypothetical protein
VDELTIGRRMPQRPAVPSVCPEHAYNVPIKNVDALIEGKVMVQYEASLRY